MVKMVEIAKFTQPFHNVQILIYTAKVMCLITCIIWMTPVRFLDFFYT